MSIHVCLSVDDDDDDDDDDMSDDVSDDVSGMSGEDSGYYDSSECQLRPSDCEICGLV